MHAVSRRSWATGEDGLKWWRGDLAEPTVAAEIIAGIRPHVIFHLASLVSGTRDRDLVIPMLRSNLFSAVYILMAAADHACPVVIAGSMEEPDHSADDPVPCSPYSAAKWAASGYARMFHSLYGVSAVILRIFMTYGPEQNDLHKLIPYSILATLRGEPPRISCGRRQVDWIFIEDVVDALITAGKIDGLNGVTLDIGSGELTTVRQIAESVTHLINPAIEPLFGAIAERPLGSVRTADVARTEKLLGWRPRVSLERGLKRTVDWYKDRFATFQGESHDPYTHIVGQNSRSPSK